jgi:hypothetical protein
VHARPVRAERFRGGQHYSTLKSRRDLALENVAPRHQLMVLHFDRNAPATWAEIRKRLIGSIRREYLDHVVVLGERHLMRVLRGYASYYHRSRTHRSLDDDCPDPREVEPPEMGDVVALAQVGGLHRYTRRLAA